MTDAYANLKPVDSSFFIGNQPEDEAADHLISYNTKDLDNNNTISQSIKNKIKTFRRTKAAKFIFEIILFLLFAAMAIAIAIGIGAGIFTARHSFTAILAIGFPYACLFAFDFIFRKLLSRKAPADSVTKHWLYKLSLFFAVVIFIVAIPMWSVISDFYQDPQDWLFRNIGLSSFFGIALLCTVISAVLECYLNSKPNDVAAAGDERTIAIMNRLAFIVDKNIHDDPNFNLSSNFIANLNQLNTKSKLSAIYNLAVWFKEHPGERDAGFAQSLGAKIDQIKTDFNIRPAVSAASSAIASTSTNSAPESVAPTTLAPAINSATASAAPAPLLTPINSVTEPLLDGKSASANTLG